MRLSSGPLYVGDSVQIIREGGGGDRRQGDMREVTLQVYEQARRAKAKSKGFGGAYNDSSQWLCAPQRVRDAIGATRVYLSHYTECSTASNGWSSSAFGR